MPRSLDYIHSEIIRVAETLDLDPRSREFSRAKFLKDDLDLPTDVTKHDLEYYGGWGKLKHDAAHVGGIEPDKDMPASRGVELRNLYVRKLERKVATSDYFRERLEAAFAEIFSKNKVKLSTKKYVSTKKKPDTLLTLLWSDLHFGVDVHDYEVYSSSFNWKIAARRIAKLCLEAVGS